MLRAFWVSLSPDRHVYWLLLKGIGRTFMSHSFNEARVKVAHPYLTMMGLYLGGFTGMFSETCLNIALPQLGVAFGVDTAITQGSSLDTCW